MPKGFDTTANCGGLARDIAATDLEFIARYYAHHGSKRLTADEAQRVSAAGLKIVVVWEDNPTKTEYFSRARGVDDGSSAYHAAMQLGQPAGSAIYFAVDYDASRAAIAGAIADYFNGVHDAFEAMAQGRPPAYSVGVYGSGATCSWLLTQGLVSYTWLAQSTGWAGFAGFTDWNIKQGRETQLFGIDVDPDDATDDYGAFAVPLLTV